MAFDTRAFIRDKFEPRTEEIQVPALKKYFGSEESPVFVVRGLTGNELAMANEAVPAQKRLEDIAAAIAGGSKDRIEEIRAAIGLSDKDVPADNVKRFQYLMFGSVEPKIDEDTAKYINERFPVEFRILTNKIVELTGLGMDVKKPLPSGERA